MSKKTSSPCQCSTFRVLETGENTGCPGTSTSRTFAPGHDAKLKGFLIRAGAAGHDVHSNGLTKSAVAWAEGFGFGRQVWDGIVRSSTKPTKKAKADEPAKPQTVSAKVGRWIYEGTIDGTTFTYIDANSNTRTATKFTLV